MDLLKVAREENNSNEVACVVDLIRNEKTKFIKGERHEVNVYSDSDVFIYYILQKTILLHCVTIIRD